jgi:hypothetical protein
LKDFENVEEETLIQGLQSDACDPGSNTLLMQTLSLPQEENGKEGNRVSVTLQYFSLLTLLYSMWFRWAVNVIWHYNSKINLNSCEEKSKQSWETNVTEYFLK